MGVQVILVHTVAGTVGEGSQIEGLVCMCEACAWPGFGVGVGLRLRPHFISLARVVVVGMEGCRRGEEWE